MKHLKPYNFFLERNDSAFAEKLSEEARGFFDTIKGRVVEFFQQYIDNCKEYDAEKCSDYLDKLWTTNWDYARIGRPPVQVYIKTSSTANYRAAASYITTSRKIEVYSPELKQLLTLFEKYAGDALSAPKEDRHFDRHYAFEYMELIKNFNYKSLIESLQHELVHHYDYNSKNKIGQGSRGDTIMKDKWQKDKQLRKLPKDAIEDEYFKSPEFIKKADAVYYNFNHEYQAYFMSYVASVVNDIKNGKPLPANFQDFKQMSTKDYQQLRLDKLDSKNQRAVIKRMYDLYIKLKQD